MDTQFGSRVKALRETQGLLQRQVAALLDMDTPLYSKIERGERTAKKEIAIHLAAILHADESELLTLWLADQLMNVLKDEKLAAEALKTVSKNIKKKQ
jgi:transcriptional regulator with XRE-family HTH domain